MVELSKQLPTGHFDIVHTLPETNHPEPPDTLDSYGFTHVFGKAVPSSAAMYRCSLLDTNISVLSETTVIVVSRYIMHFTAASYRSTRRTLEKTLKEPSKYFLIRYCD